MPTIPIDYKQFFRDRTIIITGVGRSGTTILGKLLGSCENCAYLFEPAIMKYGIDDNPAFLGTLFEDYFLPMLQGRSLNYNSFDDSWIRHYWTGEQIVEAMKRRTRKDAVQYAKDSGVRFVIKTNELALPCSELNEIFPGVKVVHIVRHGNDVILSTLKKGWYTDEYMRGSCIDVTFGDGMPWFVGNSCDGAHHHWKDYNQATRIACVWRSLVARDFSLRFKYEDLVYCPEFIVDWIIKELGLTQTMLTIKHIADIKQRGRKQYESILDQIQQPERTLYCKTLESLGYKP